MIFRVPPSPAPIRACSSTVILSSVPVKQLASYICKAETILQFKNIKRPMGIKHVTIRLETFKYQNTYC